MVSHRRDVDISPGRGRTSVFHVTWMEAESRKSSCCRRRGMEEDCMSSNKTNMYLGSGLLLSSAVAR